MSIVDGQWRAFPFWFLRSTDSWKLDIIRWIETEAAFVGTPMAPRGTMLAALCLFLFQSLRRRFKTIFSSNEQQFCTDLAAPLLLQHQILAVLLQMKLDTGLRLAGAMYLDRVLDYGDGAVQSDCSTWHNREDFVKKKTPKKATLVFFLGHRKHGRWEISKFCPSPIAQWYLSGFHWQVLKVWAVQLLAKGTSVRMRLMVNDGKWHGVTYTITL